MLSTTKPVETVAACCTTLRATNSVGRLYAFYLKASCRSRTANLSTPATAVLLCGGEALLPTSLVCEHLCRRSFSGSAVVNVYGPTETCVNVNANPITAQTVPHVCAVVPMGRPFENSSMCWTPSCSRFRSGAGGLHIRGRPGARLSESTGSDPRAVCSQSRFVDEARRSDVQDRRPGALATRRENRISGRRDFQVESADTGLNWEIGRCSSPCPGRKLCCDGAGIGFF